MCFFLSLFFSEIFGAKFWKIFRKIGKIRL